jgi:hypothetical protein
VADSWIAKKNFPGPVRYWAPAFSVDDYGYVCLGQADGTGRRDLWQYNPVRDSWTAKAAPPIAGIYGGSVGLNGEVVNASHLGFAVMGIHNGCLEYNPATDRWGTLPDVPGGNRGNFSAFMIGKALFVGGGTAASSNNGRDDLDALIFSN